jgi:hypothetical protein
MCKKNINEMLSEYIYKPNDCEFCGYHIFYDQDGNMYDEDFNMKNIPLELTKFLRATMDEVRARQTEICVGLLAERIDYDELNLSFVQ